jgi:outer membrane usher protein FimD/PapC
MRTHNTITAEPGITIRREAKICIHKQTLREYGLEDLKFVTLEYDADKSLLKIRPSVEGNSSSFEVVRERGNVSVILCREWLDQNQIPYQDGPAKVFNAEWDKGSQTILVKLSY